MTERLWRKCLGLVPMGVFFILTSLGTLSFAQTLRWATASDIQTVDPHAQNERLTNSFNAHIYEKLTARDAQLSIVPGLAQSWKQLSPLHWRFFLRKGVRFHHGAPLTAEDVVFSVQRAQSPGSGIAQYAKALGQVQISGPMQIDFLLPQPNPVFLDHIDALFIMNRAWAVQHQWDKPLDRSTGATARAMMLASGTGPYQLVSRQVDVKNVLTRHPHYWQKIPGNIATLEHIVISAAATRMAALRSGEVDLVQDVPPQDILPLQQDPHIKLWQAAENRVSFLGFDQQSVHDKVTGLPNPWRVLAVRQAVAHAIDSRALREKVLMGLALPAACLMPDVRACIQPENDRSPFPFDPQKARQLLAQAGYAEGFDITLDCPNDRYVQDEAVCTAIASMLAKVNIRVRVQAEPKARFYPRLDTLDSRFFVIGWGGADTDAQPTLDTIMHSYDEKTGKGSDNYGRYSNAAIDALIDQAGASVDAAKRHTWIQQALQMHRDQVHHHVLFRHKLVWASVSQVQPVLAANNHFRAWLTRMQR